MAAMNLKKHRLLLIGIFSPLLAIVLNIVVIQILLAVTSRPESNWRFRLIVSSLALPVPFLVALLWARKDRQNGVLSLSGKIGLGIATLSLLLIAKPVMDGFTRSKQELRMAMHTPAPSFETVDIHGKLQRLADYKGSVVLINLWATWCEPCRNEMPQLDQLYRSQKGNGLVVLGMSEEGVATQQKFLDQIPVSYPLLTVTPGVPAFYRDIAKYPATFLIDREGMLEPAPNESEGVEKLKSVVDGLIGAHK
jgi:cytochrome c biogenesis protein CcmG, thiol:disulfide interchange protein DsbE